MEYEIDPRTTSRLTDERAACCEYHGSGGDLPGCVHRAEPDPEQVRGRCPECGAEVVSRAVWVAGTGYRIVWECYAGCGYHRML